MKVNKSFCKLLQIFGAFILFYFTRASGLTGGEVGMKCVERPEVKLPRSDQSVPNVHQSINVHPNVAVRNHLATRNPLPLTSRSRRLPMTSSSRRSRLRKTLPMTSFRVTTRRTGKRRQCLPLLRRTWATKIGRATRTSFTRNWTNTNRPWSVSLYVLRRNHIDVRAWQYVKSLHIFPSPSPPQKKTIHTFGLP